MLRQSKRDPTDWLAWMGIGRVAACAALVGAGVLAGAALPPTGTARGEVQSAAQPQHFQSGSQLAVPVLKEIAATLQQMDARLARLETLAQQLRPAKAKQTSLDQR